MSYRYKREIFSNIWELVYWIYCEEHHIDLKRNKTPCLRSDGQAICFDFISNNRYISIKSNNLKTRKDWPLILEAYVKYNVTVLSHTDLEYMFNYIYKKYGKSYLKSFKEKTDKDFKRDIIEYDEISQEQFNKQKHKNVRFHYKCTTCYTDVYTTWNLIDHFSDHLCKHCRNEKVKK